MENRFEECIAELQGLDKDELSEREFYEKVLEVLQKIPEINLKTAGVLRDTLRDIGCKKYSEWENEKKQKGKEIEETPEYYSSTADIVTAVKTIDKFFGDNQSVIWALEDFVESEEIQDWIKTSKAQRNRLNIPYYQSIKYALIEKYNCSEEEAIIEIEDLSESELEGCIFASDSMGYVINFIKETLELTEEEENELGRFTFHDASKKVNILEKISSMGLDKNAVIMDALFAVQDGWVREDETFKKDVARGKDYLSLPSELLGWQNTKNDLWFVKPVFEAAGIEVNEEELEKEYNERVKEFFLDKKITGPIDLVDLLSKGEKFYPALHGQEGIIACLEDNEFVIAKVIPQIEENGIGKIDEVREKILEDIIKKPKREDIERLVEVERAEVDIRLTEKLEAATQELEEEKKKNKLVEGILNKSKLLEKTNQEIEELKSKRRNTDDRDDFGE